MRKFCQKFLKSLIATTMVVQFGSALALDANAQGTQGNRVNSQVNSIAVSMDDVARMIRQNSQWQILDARPRQNGSIMRYRFKLISNKGEVKIISIDPRKPNLRRLEQ